MAIGASREHFQGEERSVFPMLEKSLGEETLTALGKTWLQRQAAAANGAGVGGRGGPGLPLLEVDVVPVEPGARLFSLSRMTDGDAGHRNDGRWQRQNLLQSGHSLY